MIIALLPICAVTTMNDDAAFHDEIFACSEFGETVDPYLPCLVMGGTDGKNFQILRPVLTRDPSVEASAAKRISQVAVAQNIASIFSVFGLTTTSQDVKRIVGIEDPPDIKPQSADLLSTISESQEDNQPDAGEVNAADTVMESSHNNAVAECLDENLPLVDLDTQEVDFTVEEHVNDDQLVIDEGTKPLQSG